MIHSFRDVEYEATRDRKPTGAIVFGANSCVAHFHHQMELLYVLKGGYTVNINGAEYQLSDGDVCISDSYDIHTYYNQLPDTESYVVIVSKSSLPEFAGKLKNKVFKEHIAPAEAKPILDALFKLLISHTAPKSSFAAPNDEGSLFANSITCAILSVLLEFLELRSGLEQSGINSMRNILSYIHENSHTSLSLNSIAKKFGYTPNHFSHLFNTYVSCGLKSYINSIRLQNAALKISSGENVTDAALSSGFNSIETFYRSFKKEYGTTPNKYIK